MTLQGTEKTELIEKFARGDGDTGSPEVQIAIWTTRINQLQEHLNQHKHDQSTRRGLLKLVGKRRRMLKYMKSQHPERYRALISELGLRR